MWSPKPTPKQCVSPSKVLFGGIGDTPLKSRWSWFDSVLSRPRNGSQRSGPLSGPSGTYASPGPTGRGCVRRTAPSGLCVPAGFSGKSRFCHTSGVVDAHHRRMFIIAPMFLAVVDLSWSPRFETLIQVTPGLSRCSTDGICAIDSLKCQRVARLCLSVYSAKLCSCYIRVATICSCTHWNYPPGFFSDV